MPLHLRTMALAVPVLLLPLAASAARPRHPQQSPARPATRATAAKAAAPETLRYAIFLSGARIGSLTTTTAPVTHNKRPALRVDADSKIAVSTLGQSLEQEIRLSQVVDTAGRPQTTSLTIRSGGRSTTIRARFERTRVVCTVDAGAGAERRVVPIPPGVVLVADPEHAPRRAQPDRLKPGVSSRMHFFEPVTMTIQQIESTVARSEPRAIGGRQVTAYLIRTRNPLTGASESWVDGRGRLLEEASPLGLRVVREDLVPREAAQRYVPPPDFAVATAIRTATPIPDPRRVEFLRLRISGITDPLLVLGDGRQQIEAREERDGTLTVSYRVEARALPQHADALASPGAALPGLGDAPYLGIASPEIRQQARSLTDGGPDRAEAARRIRAWVKQHMLRPSNVGTPRAAAEIMRSRDGVCRDYATLFAAVARAAGLPTRVCAGIVSFNNAFYYHAWVECQLTEGDDGWYPLDPTMDTDFVDATHVKFTQGDPVAMYGALRLVGQVTAEVLEMRTAPTLEAPEGK